MRSFDGKRYWLVGASAGLGRALADKLVAAGAEVVLSARSEDDLKQAVSELGEKASYVTLDVSDNDDVIRAAKEVGEIDGYVHLAGVYWPQGAKEWDADQVNAMCDINFTGTARVLGQVVPDMVKRDRGHIVITSSLTGFRGLPGSIGYTASKAATMSLAECMYADLRKTGVDVQVINPGFIKTQLTDKNDFNMPFIMEPEEAAQIVFDHMKSGGFKRSFPTLFSLVFRGSQFLPDWIYYRIFS
ncbi:SDR family NAD(P)-dependent oxidoreductase [Litoreibacter arenae]|uniref:Oxidoreductase, short-chain dehydrogenase/reductase family n=1 Tax=Litoreibacter arenae DSM 19593 TaxID=1123360 RepID=S9RV72_9RHOB|nr:SDR family NAD(P)-dependent oxidoreductase [Litoreibacter arenae]EPX77869.1 Oxidoreductase, short-chain dehydrogenase/reductase family [Litoreibacter arenae DSM 19593]